MRRSTPLTDVRDLVTQQRPIHKACMHKLRLRVDAELHDRADELAHGYRINISLTPEEAIYAECLAKDLQDAHYTCKIQVRNLARGGEVDTYAKVSIPLQHRQALNSGKRPAETNDQ